MKNYARTPDVQALPSLIEVQLNSFKWFLEEGLAELFDEISPIESYNGSLKLYFPGNSAEAQEFGLRYWFEEPKYSEEVCLERDMSFAAPLYIRVALVNREAGDEVGHLRHLPRRLPIDDGKRHVHYQWNGARRRQSVDFALRACISTRTRTGPPAVSSRTPS